MNLHWNLAPRYTAGSPAAVWDEKLAHRVAAEEKEDYERTLEGIYGEPAKLRAQNLGLAGIVEERREYKGGWKVVDLITGRRFFRERKLVQRLQPGDIVTRYDPQGQAEVTGQFRVLEVERSKSQGIVAVRLKDGPPPIGYVCVSEGSWVTVEKDMPLP